MSVPSVNLRIEKGTYFEASFSLAGADNTPAVLLNYSATAKIRKHPAATDSVSFQTNITGSTGVITITMSNDVTSTLSSGRNYYDVVITESSSGRKTKVFEGMAMVYDTVSI